VSTESIVIDGRAFTVGFSDRNYEYLDRFAPYIIENGGDMPSRLGPETQAAVRALVERAAASLGVRTGVVKGDIVVHEGKPYVIELAARLSGGYFCTHQIPLNTGVDIVGAAIRIALGERPAEDSLIPTRSRGVSQRFVFPAPGRVVTAGGAEEVSRRPGIRLCEVRVRPGDVVGPMESHPARAGVVIAEGTTREEATERARAGVEALRIETAA
jgi:biotin carboxylase